MPDRHLTPDNRGDLFSEREKMNIFKKQKSGSILIFTLVLGMMALLAPLENSAAENNMNRDLFAQGNTAYAKGEYDQAIEYYKAALTREGYTPSLLYNLGNAYYMKNEMGQSILNYERALYLDPGNIDIEANLALARKKRRSGGAGANILEGFLQWLNPERMDMGRRHYLVCLFTDDPRKRDSPRYSQGACAENDGLLLLAAIHGKPAPAWSFNTKT